MVTHWFQRESKRGTVRVFLVAMLAGIALAISIPYLYCIAYPMYGEFGFVSDDSNVVVYTEPRAEAAGVKDGDLVQYSELPLEHRYWVGGTPRLPSIGTKVTFPLLRDGRPHTATLTAEYHRSDWIWRLWPGIIKRAASLILIIVAMALLLVRPARVTWAFFVYALGSIHTSPRFLLVSATVGIFVLRIYCRRVRCCRRAVRIPVVGA
jgi:hypothetical protein